MGSEMCIRDRGFERFYFLNGHGGNISSARAAFQEIYTKYSLRAEESSSPRCRIRSWWEYPKTNSLRLNMYGEKEGMHATPSEVAMAQYVYPEHTKEVSNVEWKPLSSEYLNSHKGDDHFDAEQHRRSYPDGRIGSDPSLAKPEGGQQLLETAAAEMLEDYKKFLEEE